MATRCGHSSKGDPDELCDKCEEHQRQLHREANGRFCLHCGKAMMPATFERHKWQVYYREGYHPRARRVQL